MSFKDLDEFFDDTLKLPVGAKVYVIASVDAATGLWCQRMMGTAAAVAGGAEMSEDDVRPLMLDDAAETDLYKRVLGGVYDELIADGVSWERLKHIGTTAFMWAAGSRESAEDYWNSASIQAPGKPRRPAPQDHKVPARKKSARKTSGRPASPAGSTNP